MTSIAASLPSLPPVPPFVPGGTAGVVAPGKEPSDKSRTAAADATPTARSTNEPENPARAPAATDAASIEEQRLLTELKARDREVRSHENAHRAAGGDLVRGGSYDYQQGPDGKRYAIGGDVQIDTTPVPGDPDATADKMARVIRAALAPAEPSPTDLAVAAQATAERNRAQADARAGDGDGNAIDGQGKANQDGDGDGNESSEAAGAYRRTAEQAVTGENLNAMA
ncbi:MAG: putative metalloprotease CJM1_0395 family protein [Guyparkeria sp.]